MNHTQQTYERIVFCDFDGTITQKETLVAMLSEFVPEKMNEFGRKFAQGKVTLREGVRHVVEAIPSREYEKAVDFIMTQKIRDGFLEFLVFLKERQVPFVVISGGLKDSVQKRLQPYMKYIHALYAAEIDATGEYVKVLSPFEAEDELVSKVRIMELYNFRESVAIGDGATDHQMALHSTIVFARKRLADFLEQNGKKFVPWKDFFDIKEHLMRVWQS